MGQPPANSFVYPAVQVLMGKDSTRLSTDRTNFNGPQERAGADHLVEAIEEGILTPEGSLALDGGHLAGNKDQLHAGNRTHGHASPVPGAKGLAAKSEGEGYDATAPEPMDGVPPVESLV